MMRNSSIEQPFSKPHIFAMYMIVFFVFSLLFPHQVHAQDWELSGLQESRIEPMETAPWGVLAGEFDTRLWLTPYNGLYISKNLGNSWHPLGLENRGITDISYSDGKIYASTYYTHDDKVGLFVSANGGTSWNHLGNNFSTSTVSSIKSTILLGTYSHGLWMSGDAGQTWRQILGDGYFGPEIKEVVATETLLIASETNNTYISTNNGETWRIISELEGIHVQEIEVIDSIILIGTSNDEGMYKSEDGGNTWRKLITWGDYSSGGMELFQNNLYAAKLNDIYKSSDFGETWEPTQMLTQFGEGNAHSITSAYSNPSYLFASVPIEGVYRKPFSKPPIRQESLFEIPWSAASPNELIERLYSYFDHSYPLINYPYHNEPQEDRNTTLNFLGTERAEPEMYYSGHDGIDFVLDYGTPIFAVANGNATYEWSEVRGHTIKIDHQNGYISEYSHLQENVIDTPTEVSAGTKIGLVGNSGISTGAHLHFSVEKSGKKTDPFGWQSETLSDPWTTYLWSDVSGAHTGTSSKYLWKEFPETVGTYIDNNGGEVVLNNKQIIIDQNSLDYGFTVFVEPYEYPKVPISQNKLTYITGTSVLVNLYNILGEPIPLLAKPVKIEMDFGNANLDDILKNTIRFYFFNEQKKIWEEVDSIYDVATRRLLGESYHFSHFAAFGEKIIKKVTVDAMSFRVT